jgi:hypothetical protein
VHQLAQVAAAVQSAAQAGKVRRDVAWRDKVVGATDVTHKPVVVGGRVDGYNGEDGTLLEVKNRTKRLFDRVVRYENVQLHVSGRRRRRGRWRFGSNALSCEELQGVVSGWAGRAALLWLSDDARPAFVLRCCQSSINASPWLVVVAAVAAATGDGGGGGGGGGGGWWWLVVLCCLVAGWLPARRTCSSWAWTSASCCSGSSRVRTRRSRKTCPSTRCSGAKSRRSWCVLRLLFVSYRAGVARSWKSSGLASKSTSEREKERNTDRKREREERDRGSGRETGRGTEMERARPDRQTVAVDEGKMGVLNFSCNATSAASAGIALLLLQWCPRLFDDDVRSHKRTTALSLALYLFATTGWSGVATRWPAGQMMVANGIDSFTQNSMALEHYEQLSSDNDKQVRRADWLFVFVGVYRVLRAVLLLSVCLFRLGVKV